MVVWQGELWFDVDHADAVSFLRIHHMNSFSITKYPAFLTYHRCPVCSQGKLGLFDEDAGDTIKCAGYWDEDLNLKTRCTYAVPNSSAPRLKPWYAEEPSEEQKEEMKEYTEQQKAIATGKSPNGAPKELLEAAEKLEWPDTSDPSQRKKACELMYELCTSGSVKIDLPEDQKKAKQKIFGLFSTASGSLSATEVLQSVVKEFGIAAAKAEAKKKQEKALAAGCECPANAAVLQAFQELSDLYFKGGNSNAGISVSLAHVMECVYSFASYHPAHFALPTISFSSKRWLLPSRDSAMRLPSIMSWVSTKDLRKCLVLAKVLLIKSRSSFRRVRFRSLRRSACLQHKAFFQVGNELSRIGRD